MQGRARTVTNRAWAADTEMFPGLESLQGQSSTVALWLTGASSEKDLHLQAGMAAVNYGEKGVHRHPFVYHPEAQGETAAPWGVGSDVTWGTGNVQTLILQEWWVGVLTILSNPSSLKWKFQ